MQKNPTYEETLNGKKSKIYIDCRTPSEYKKSTISGAINIPTLLDNERAQIGTLYVNGDVEKAKMLGVDAVSKRLPEMFKQIQELKKQYENLYFFCSRGGYRSNSIVSVLNALDERVYKLQGGYKYYRNYIINNLPRLIDSVKPITLYGFTGTGKTSILKELSSLGFKILDLEGYANHRGSLLGNIGKNEQFSQKKFDSLLFDDLKKYENSYVFVEGESSKIGKVTVPKRLLDKMNDGIKIYIDADIDFRINEIKNIYLPDFGNDNSLMKEFIKKLEKYISSERMQKYYNYIDNGNFDSLLKDLCLKYYDINYNIPKVKFEKNYMNVNSKATAKKIAEDFKNILN